MISQLVSLDERAGTNVSGYKTIDDVLGAASLNFNVEKTPAHDPEGNEVPGVNLIRRTDTNTVLGTCGKRYQVIDNRDVRAIRERGGERWGPVRERRYYRCW